MYPPTTLNCARVAVISDFEAPPPDLENCADIVELRLDCAAERDPGLLSRRVKSLRMHYGQDYPFIVTIRSAREFGSWDGDEEQRLACYLAVLEDAEYVDIEAGAGIALALADEAHKRARKLIASWHTDAPPHGREELEEISSALGAFYWKLAASTPTLASVVALARLMQGRDTAQKKPCPVTMGMGAEGALTRVLMPWMGSRLVYGFCAQPAVVSGQVSLPLVSECLALFERGPEQGRNSGGLVDAMRHLYESGEYAGSADWASIERAISDLCA